MSQLVEGFSSMLNEKIVQISLVGGILFYILATPENLCVYGRYA